MDLGGLQSLKTSQLSNALRGGCSKSLSGSALLSFGSGTIQVLQVLEAPRCCGQRIAVAFIQFNDGLNGGWHLADKASDIDAAFTQCSHRLPVLCGSVLEMNESNAVAEFLEKGCGIESCGLRPIDVDLKEDVVREPLIQELVAVGAAGGNGLTLPPMIVQAEVALVSCGIGGRLRIGIGQPSPAVQGIYIGVPRPAMPDQVSTSVGGSDVQDSLGSTADGEICVKGDGSEVSCLEFPRQLVMGDVGRGWCHFHTFKSCGTNSIERWTERSLECVANRVELESRGKHGAGESMSVRCKMPQDFCHD